MMDSLDMPYIAIDGGGTSCRFALSSSGRVVAVRRGSANVFSAPEMAVETLTSGLAELAAQARISVERLSDFPLYAGLAGVTDANAAEIVAGKLPCRHVKIEDDRRSAVVGALGAGSGSLIGIGTGSFLARQEGGDVAFVGGYGAVLGDQASAGWLGRTLLCRALLTLDGLEETSDLIENCLTEFKYDAARIVKFTTSAQPSDYGTYAPQVVKAAKSDDPVGRVLMSAGADYICRALTALGRESGEAVCAIGGVAAHYADFLPSDIRADMVDPQGEALDGALELARRFSVQVGRGQI